MSNGPSLFEEPVTPVISNRAILLATGKHIYLGTSSWKYEGWQGMVYNDHYSSKRAFERTCLREYSRYFPAVGVDATFYRFPGEQLLEQLHVLTPDHFRFGLKVTEEITVFKYPDHPRYGKRKGWDNPAFLDAGLFIDAFLEPVSMLGDKLGPIIFQFGTLPKNMVTDGSFLHRLDAFLEILPKGFQYSIEIRNRDLFSARYFDVLKSHNAAHVHSSWSWMPPLYDQLSMASSITADFFVMRLLTPPQVAYRDAVESFFPYTKIQRPQLKTRDAAIKQIEKAILTDFPGYVFINNRLEGASPLTIEAVLDQVLGRMEGEL